MRAETAEREADKALIASRKAVKEARDHVKHLEREAAEESVSSCEWRWLITLTNIVLFHK
jgi:hypothetical protein